MADKGKRGVAAPASASKKIVIDPETFSTRLIKITRELGDKARLR